MAVSISGQPQVFVGVGTGRELSTPAPFLKHVWLGFFPGNEGTRLLLKVHDRARIETERIPQFLGNPDIAVGLNSGVHKLKLGIPNL